MSKSTPKFPAFHRAVKAQEEAATLLNEVRDLESKLAGLKMDPDLSATEAARAFVRKEDTLKSSLREARLALSHSDPDASPLWRNAVSEMRHTAVAGIEAELEALQARCGAAAAALLAPIMAVGREAPAASNSALVSEVNSLVREFRQTCSEAVNGGAEGIAARVTALHDLIEAVPARIKALLAMATAYEEAADAVKARFAKLPVPA